MKSQCSRRIRLTILLHTALVFVLTMGLASSQPQTTPGDLREYATLHSIGIEWDISGDNNHNATVSVQYRKQGVIPWSQALPLFRSDYNGFNMLAGSILYLDPNTTYEVQLNLSDPDGGNHSKLISVTTHPIPTLPAYGNTWHVIPGNGGGDGSAGNPFQGVGVAQAVAQPGDIFLLHEGYYPGETLFNRSGAPNNYIVWKAAGDGEAVFHNLRISADHIWLEGLKITAPDYGLRTYNAPMDVVLQCNRFVKNHYCIYLNHGGENWRIMHNIIEGDTDPSSGSFSGEGVELNHTSGHVVAHNLISRVADGISYPHHNVDIYGNDIFDLSDDGIEPDYGFSNIRIWNNRISNALHNGISFQPMNSGPWYLIRNQVAAPAENALKLRTSTDRALLAHNTLVAWQGPQTVQTHLLLSMQSNNNLWITVKDWYAWENSQGGAPDWRTNLDYDGFDWGNYVYAFKWGPRYSDLLSFQAATGLELNGIHVDKSACFETFDVPNPPPAPVPFQHMTLKAGCNAIDAGVVLPNINEDYLGAAPDLGAYELGAPLPVYGPLKYVYPYPLYVPDYYPTIQEAIHVIGKNAKGDTIHVRPGIYYENLDFQGKSFTLKSTDGAQKTVIDGGGIASVVTFQGAEGPDTVLDGFTITNGAGAPDGGGLLCKNKAAPFVVNCVIRDNVGDHGGGVFCETDAQPTLVNNTICSNTAAIEGGAMACASAGPKIINSILWNNVAPAGAQIQGQPSVSHCNVQGGFPGFGNIDGDPLFADTAQGDYHLTFSSPCKDVGHNPSVITSADYEGDPRMAFNVTDMGADEFHTHLYYMGAGAPGGLVELKIIGLPGASPIGLWIAFDLLKTPVSGAYGEWWLMFPVVGPFDLGAIPPNGVLSLPGMIPTSPPGPYALYFQGLLGTPLTLTNPCAMEVK